MDESKSNLSRRKAPKSEPCMPEPQSSDNDNYSSGDDIENSSDSDSSLSSQILSNLSKKLPKIEKIAHKAWKAVHFDTLPDWLKDNEFLRRHHRPPMYSMRGCLKSMFRLHTETLNIWTHLIGFIFFTFLTASVYVLRDSITQFFEDITISDLPWQEQCIILLFFLGAMTCLFCSTAFHTLGNHSERIFNIFSKLDYLGIAFLITGSGIPAVYYVFYCTTISRYVHMAMLILLGLCSIVISFWDKFNQREYRGFRALVFVLFGLYYAVPAIQVMVERGFAEPLGKFVVGLVIMAMLYLGGAGLYASRIPERFRPGMFDVWAHSHQIFHVCVVAAALVYYDALLILVKHRLINGNCPTLELLINSAPVQVTV